MKKFVCQLCGYVYSVKDGDLENGIEPETEFDELPSDWVCPLCGASKDDFEKLEKGMENDF